VRAEGQSGGAAVFLAGLFAAGFLGLGARNRAMILVLLDTGVRRTELVDLDLADLDLAGQRLRVLHGKGNKQRVVRFGTKAGEAVEDYLERFRGREPGALFLSRHGTRMSSHSVLIFLRRLGRRPTWTGDVVAAPTT